MRTIYKLLIALAIGVIGGFFIGRATINTKTVVKYVKGETVRDTITIFKPIRETPTDEYPSEFVKTDTVYVDSIQYITSKLDSALIAKDFAIKREYHFNVFDNDLGKFDAMPIVQYNKLSSFAYEFTPIQKQTTIYKEKLFTPFVSVGYNTLGYIGAGIGMFYKNIGLEYNYNIKNYHESYELDDKNYHAIKLNYKF
jgi:hypothetical protein